MIETLPYSPTFPLSTLTATAPNDKLARCACCDESSCPGPACPKGSSVRAYRSASDLHHRHADGKRGPWRHHAREGRRPIQRLRPALPMLRLRMIRIRDLTNRRQRVHVDIANFTARQANLGHRPFLRHQLSGSCPRCGPTDRHGQDKAQCCAHCAQRNAANGQSISNPNIRIRAGHHRVANL